MSNRSLTQELLDRGGKNGAINGPVPIRIAPRDPIAEIVVEEVAARLPDALAKKLRTTEDSQELHNWVAAGAIYDLIRGNREIEQVFLEQVGMDPRGAGRAALSAMALNVAPPPRSLPWHVADAIGALSQIIAYVLFLGLLGLVVPFMQKIAGVSSQPLDMQTRLLLMLDAGLVKGWSAAGGWAIVGYITLLAGLLLELYLAPVVSEGLRRFPVRVAGFVSPHCRRRDGLNLLFSLWVCFLSCLGATRVIKASYSYGSVRWGGDSIYRISPVALLLPLFIVVAYLAINLMARAIRIGMPRPAGGGNRSSASTRISTSWDRQAAGEHKPL